MDTLFHHGLLLRIRLRPVLRQQFQERSAADLARQLHERGVSVDRSGELLAQTVANDRLAGKLLRGRCVCAEVPPTHRLLNPRERGQLRLAGDRVQRRLQVVDATVEEVQQRYGQVRFGHAARAIHRAAARACSSDLRMRARLLEKRQRKHSAHPTLGPRWRRLLAGGRTAFRSAPQQCRVSRGQPVPCPQRFDQ